MIRAAVAAAFILPAAGWANDFPTEARVEYAIYCMAANGQGPENLRRCSCKVDELAGLISYRDYVAAETVLRMQQTSGERSTVFRGGGMTVDLVERFRIAEAEADLICF
ncbi:MAG: hypothetical protein Q4G36_12145 [Paracoccus sp. (in: a-proteobacteria)]|nr:hypothetical protein [Paracoccus sp. (in: a-proteobacteria)]